MTDETARTPRHAILIDTLAGVFDALESREPSARVRELRARAQTYERAVKEWAHRQPSTAQFAAMLDCVVELREKVMRPDAAEPGASLAPQSETRSKDAGARPGAPRRRPSSG